MDYKALYEQSQKENEELKEDKEVLEDMTRRLDWASECEPLRCGYHKQFEHAVSRLIEFNEELKNETEKVKKDFEHSEEMMMKLLEIHNLQEEEYLVYHILKKKITKRQCRYCRDDGCGMRPDGVECKDCYQTIMDEMNS